jgi:SAM-dependent methyltransferase
MAKLVVDIRRRNRVVREQKQTQSNWEDGEDQHAPTGLYREALGVGGKVGFPDKGEENQQRREREFDEVGGTEPNRVMKRQEGPEYVEKEHQGVTSSIYTLEDLERMALAKNYFAWQARLVHRELGNRVLEVGCGIGNFTGTLLDREIVVAVDIEPECLDHLRARYGTHTNLHTRIGDAGQDGLRVIDRFKLDSCVCLNVLEHIEDDAAAICSMASVLVAGAKIVLILPAFPALYGPIDRNLGHFRRYTRRSIFELATRCDVNVRKMHYMNSAGFFGWWLNAHVLKKEKQSAAQIAFFDRYVVPFISRAEGWVTPPFGQSLFVVLEKA